MTVPTPLGWLPSEGRMIPVTWYTAYCARLMQSKPKIPRPAPGLVHSAVAGPVDAPAVVTVGNARPRRRRRRQWRHPGSPQPAGCAPSRGDHTGQ